MKGLMEPKTIPCPFCQRPLQISLKKNGKIGCRQCRNVSDYNAATGVLTPLTAQNVKPRNSSQARQRTRHQHWVAVSLLLAATLAVAIALAFRLWDLVPIPPNSTVDELKALLNALSE